MIKFSYLFFQGKQYPSKKTKDCPLQGVHFYEAKISKGKA